MKPLKNLNDKQEIQFDYLKNGSKTNFITHRLSFICGKYRFILLQSMASEEHC